MNINCDICNDTGWTGDNNAGVYGNLEVHACDCAKGDKIKKAISLVGFDTVKNLLQYRAFTEQVEELKKQNRDLQNEIADLKGYARLHDVSNYKG